MLLIWVCNLTLFFADLIKNFWKSNALLSSLSFGNFQSMTANILSQQ